MWRGLADIASKYLQKGKLVYIEGKLRTRSFEDKEGNKRYTTEVVAENFTMLGRKSDFETNGQGHAVKAEEEQPVDFNGSNPDDDLPF